jgi:DNA (cytosine-5)-methyltransferase 1
VRIGSLFAGIGGFDLGLERAGMVCRWQVEIDTTCQGVLARHWPQAQRYGDICEVRGDELESVDLICGGFPCQDVSVAGKRQGLAGERSGLWYEFHRVLAEARPQWAVIENVPGLLSSNGGRDFAVILRGLVELGYGVCWRVLDAQYFGVAQRRRRVFIVGSLGDGRAAQVLFEPESLRGDSAPSREAGEGVARALANSSVSSGYRLDPNGEALIPTVADPLTTSYAKHHGASGGKDSMLRNNVIARCFNGYTGGADDNDAQAGHILAFEPRYARNDRGAPDTVVPPLKAQSGQSGKGDGAPCVVYGVSENQRGEVNLTSYSRQITTGGGKPGQGYPAVLSGMAVRRLTPVECARLQGFPDTWLDGESDSARYRMLGNAVCVPVAEWIGKRIMEAQR